MRVVDKKVNYAGLLCCANCNNSQTTAGITMHELTRNRPVVRRKWIKFMQFKRADFLAAPHHAHLCSEHFSECDFANPIEYRYSQNPAWQAQTDTAVSLWVSRAKCQCRLRSSSWPFCSDSPEWRSRHMVTWFGRRYDRKCLFFRAFIILRSQFHLHHRSQRALTKLVSKRDKDVIVLAK